MDNVEKIILNRFKKNPFGEGFGRLLERFGEGLGRIFFWWFWAFLGAPGILWGISWASHKFIVASAGFVELSLGLVLIGF